jgi:hypothetical protein
MATNNVEEPNRDPERAFIGTWIAIGAGFGIALGLVFDNLALGLAIGSAVGASIGAAVYGISQDQSNTPPANGWARLIALFILGVLVLMAGALAITLLAV